MRTLFTTALLLLQLFANAQLEIGDSILLNGVLDADRQVMGLSDPQLLTSAVSANAFQSGQLNFAAPSGPIDSLSLVMPLSPLAYSEGILVNFFAPAGNTGPMKINVNGLGYIDVRKKVSQQLDSADVAAGQLVTIIHDGVNFQMVSDLNRSCPTGFATVNDVLCIETTEKSAATFWDALRDCGDRNARLCSWGEWQNACLDAIALGLSSMTGNWEWIDSAGNYNGTTLDTMVRIAGNTGCTDADNGVQSTTSYPYRCCYTR